MERTTSVVASFLDQAYCSIRHARQVAEMPEPLLRNWLRPGGPLPLLTRDREGKPRLTVLGLVGLRIAADLAHRGPLDPADAGAIALAALAHLRAIDNRSGTPELAALFPKLAALFPPPSERSRWMLHAVIREGRATVFAESDPPSSESGSPAPARVVVLLDLAQIVREVIAADLANSLDPHNLEPGDDGAAS